MLIIKDKFTFKFIFKLFKYQSICFIKKVILKSYINMHKGIVIEWN